MRAAFSLVELSIVLVILGLLTGGILAGQSLIRAAELRGVGVQFSTFRTAAQAFRDKYLAIPGDMQNATSFWGAADGSTGITAACLNTASASALTCNGNGDGKVGVNSYSNEPFRFWQHLANAGLVEGNYDGISHPASTVGSNSANSPAGKLPSSLWFTYYWGPRSGNTTFFDGDYGNAFQFGNISVNSGSTPDTPNMRPEEMWNLDTKVDDGKPATGTVRIFNWSLNTCTDATASNQVSASYRLDVTSYQCFGAFARAY